MRFVTVGVVQTVSVPVGLVRACLSTLIIETLTQQGKVVISESQSAHNSAITSSNQATRFFFASHRPPVENIIAVVQRMLSDSNNGIKDKCP